MKAATEPSRLQDSFRVSVWIVTCWFATVGRFQKRALRRDCANEQATRAVRVDGCGWPTRFPSTSRSSGTNEEVRVNSSGNGKALEDTKHLKRAGAAALRTHRGAGHRTFFARRKKKASGSVSVIIARQGNKDEHDESLHTGARAQHSSIHYCTWMSVSSAMVRQQSMAAGVVPQSSWSLRPTAPAATIWRSDVERGDRSDRSQPRRPRQKEEAAWATAPVAATKAAGRRRQEWQNQRRRRRRRQSKIG